VLREGKGGEKTGWGLGLGNIVERGVRGSESSRSRMTAQEKLGVGKKTRNCGGKEVLGRRGRRGSARVALTGASEK